MKSRLINVRLDEDRLRKVRRLRHEGVVLSDLVREAIDSKFESVVSGGQTRNVKRLIQRLFELYPDPLDLPPRTYDVHERRAARAAIQRKLSRKRA